MKIYKCNDKESINDLKIKKKNCNEARRENKRKVENFISGMYLYIFFSYISQDIKRSYD